MTGLAIDNVLGTAQGRYTAGPGSKLDASGVSRKNAAKRSKAFSSP